MSRAHETQLAELKTWASATQDGLGQTRARLIADWRGMDQAVARRQSEVLQALDQYAATLEVRVQEFLKALDVSRPLRRLSQTPIVFRDEPGKIQVRLA